MGRKAKHHYIPKCYLKGFTDGGEDSSEFWCVPINNDAPFPTSPNDSCAKRDYYTVEHSNSLVVEEWYANNVEPKIAKSLNYIKEHSALPPKDEMRYLLLLLATLYLRVPSFRNTFEAPIKYTKKIVHSIASDVPIRNREEFDYSQTDLIFSELVLIDTVQEFLANKYYQLHIIEDANDSCITSDRPFILSHPNGGKGFHFGLNTSNVEICVPIAKNSILVARNEEFEEGDFVASKQLIGLTNTKLMLTANRFCYSSRSRILLVDDEIKAYYNDIITKNSSHQTSRLIPQ